VIGLPHEIDVAAVVTGIELLGVTSLVSLAGLVGINLMRRILGNAGE
jgi:hypothetical protein